MSTIDCDDNDAHNFSVQEEKGGGSNKQVNNEGRKGDKEEEEEEPSELTQVELEQRHDKALREKDIGNAFVQQKDYVKALQSYTNAIKVFAHDATFFANRGLCHLKLDQ